jgi:hypothetical protein
LPANTLGTLTFGISPWKEEVIVILSIFLSRRNGDTPDSDPEVVAVLMAAYCSQHGIVV